MAPSPILRRSPSPRRGLKTENPTRIRSTGKGSILKEEDDDLALFNNMENRERDSFLLHSTHDSDGPLSTKLDKHGASIPVCGKNDLLNADEEKNDYEWLLTPPDTPLFPSLKDETLSTNSGQRGRPQSQPISISRPATSEKSYRTSRSSASPHRLSTSPRSNRTGRGSASPHQLSPSPRSRNSPFQSRGRPSSAPHHSPPPHLMPITPSRRTSTSPSKPSTPSSRSSTPTSQRMNTISSGSFAFSRKRGTSPVNSHPGNCGSPKVHAWHSNDPGFSMDIPPNLRTSLSDRPVSYVRGSSPSSRNRINSSPKYGRQSMSTTAPRGSSSSYSVEQDHYSTKSRGPIELYSAVDIGSLQATTMNISDYTTSGKLETSRNTRGLVPPKKPSGVLSSTCAPKRSFDSSLQQMEQNNNRSMLKPDVVSVPNTGFYTGNVNYDYCSMISKRSSVTACIDASSEQGGNVALDIDGTTDRYQIDMVINRTKATSPGVQDQVFTFDEVDGTNEEAGEGNPDVNPIVFHHNFDISSTVEVEPGLSAKVDPQESAKEIIRDLNEHIYVADNLLEVGYRRNMKICSKCGKKFCVIQMMEEGGDICRDCSEKAECTNVTSLKTTEHGIRRPTTHSELTVEENEFSDVLEPKPSVSELQGCTPRAATQLASHKIKSEQGERPECSCKGECLSAVSSATILVSTQNCTFHSDVMVEKDDSCDVPLPSVSELQENICRRSALLGHHKSTVEESEKPVCSEEGEGMTVTSPEIIRVCSQNCTIHSEPVVKEDESCDVLVPKMSVYQFEENAKSTVMHGDDNFKDEKRESWMVQNSLAKSMVKDKLCHENQQMMGHRNDDFTKLDFRDGHSCVKTDTTEGANTSVLLQLSSSSKWPVVQGRNFAAINIPCDDPSYARKNPNSVRPFIGHNTSLEASSVDLISFNLRVDSISSKQTDIRVQGQRQLGNRRPDTENSQNDLHTNPHSCQSSFSGILSDSYRAYILSNSSDEENDGSVGNVEYKTLKDTVSAEVQGRAPSNTESGHRTAFSVKIDFLGGDEIYHSNNCTTQHTSALELSNNTIISSHLAELSVEELPNCAFISSSIADDLSDDGRSISDPEEPETTPPYTFTEEESGLNNVVDENDFVEVQICIPSVMVSGDLEYGNDDSPGPESACIGCPNSKSIVEKDPSRLVTSDKDTSVFHSCSHMTDHIDGICEESTMTVKVSGEERRSKLEELIETTLFCRSIIQKLAYQATTTAAEKGNSASLEGPSPTVSFVGKGISDRKHVRVRTDRRRTQKSQRSKHTSVETNVKIPSTKIEADTRKVKAENNSVIPSIVESTTPQKLAYKCNCVVM